MGENQRLLSVHLLDSLSSALWQILAHVDCPSLLLSKSLYRITTLHFVLDFYGGLLKEMVVREHFCT